MILDKTINTVAERINYVKGLLKNEESFSYVNLEKMADYIINSPDVPRGKKQKYNYYTDRKLFDKMIKDKKRNTEYLGFNNSNYEDEDRQIDIFIEQKFGRAKLISKDQKIYSSDYDDPIIGQAMREYDIVLKKFSRANDWKCTKFVTQTKKDQLLYKTQRKGTIYFKKITQGTTVIDWYQFDFTNPDHVIALLKLTPRPLEGGENLNLSELIYDLNNLLSMCDLTEIEERVLELWRDNNITQIIIADELNINQGMVHYYLKRIVIKIIRVYKTSVWDYYRKYKK